MAVSGTACPQDRRPAVFFYPVGHPMMYAYDKNSFKSFYSSQASFSWGIHELPKVLLGPVMPYHFTPYERTPLKRPYYPLGYPMPSGPDEIKKQAVPWVIPRNVCIKCSHPWVQSPFEIPHSFNRAFILRQNWNNLTTNSCYAWTLGTSRVRL
jgi:biotin synthase-related radical SAM superfamily protein